jgi:DNA-binding NarL/FixJ family response regulator
VAIRALIADDQRLFSASLRVVLGADPEQSIEVVGTVADGQEACNAARELTPDVILMDVHMPNMDGVEATKKIHSEQPEVKIVMLTTFDDDAYVHDAIAGGAVGYILKDIEPIDLCAAIRAVNAGSFLVSPTVGTRLATHPAAVSVPENELPYTILRAFPDLTHREAEVLSLVIASFDNHEIADQLGIAQQTVKNYTSTVYAKLGVRDRLHAVRHVRTVLASVGA